MAGVPGWSKVQPYKKDQATGPGCLSTIVELCIDQAGANGSVLSYILWRNNTSITEGNQLLERVQAGLLLLGFSRMAQGASRCVSVHIGTYRRIYKSAILAVRSNCKDNELKTTGA